RTIVRPAPASTKAISPSTRRAVRSSGSPFVMNDDSALFGDELAIPRDGGPLLLAARDAIDPACNGPFGEHVRPGLEVARCPVFRQHVFIRGICDERAGRAFEIPEEGRRDRMLSRPELRFVP